MTNLSKEVRKILIDKGMTMPELAKEVGMSRIWLYATLRGEGSEEAERKIKNYLGLEI